MFRTISTPRCAETKSQLGSSGQEGPPNRARCVNRQLDALYEELGEMELRYLNGQIRAECLWRLGRVDDAVDWGLAVKAVYDELGVLRVPPRVARPGRGAPARCPRDDRRRRLRCRRRATW